MLCKDIFFAACTQIPILHLVYHNTSFKSSKNVGFQRIFGVGVTMMSDKREIKR